MWYAKWNAAKNQFDVWHSDVKITGATKSYTKAGLFAQLRNNFAYINCMKKYGKVFFALIEVTKNAVKVVTRAIDHAKNIIAISVNTLFSDGSSEGYGFKANDGFKFRHYA